MKGCETKTWGYIKYILLDCSCSPRYNFDTYCSDTRVSGFYKCRMVAIIKTAIFSFFLTVFYKILARSCDKVIGFILSVKTMMARNLKKCLHYFKIWILKNLFYINDMNSSSSKYLFNEKLFL